MKSTCGSRCSRACCPSSETVTIYPHVWEKSQYNDLYQSIAAKYGKPFHAEKTNKEGHPFVYYSIWHIGSESVSLELKALKGHWIYKNSGVENQISMLEFNLNFYSKKAEGKGIDF